MAMKSVLMGGVALIATAGMALAADLPYKAAPAPVYAAPPAGFSWNGIYIGIHGGGEFGANDITTGGTFNGTKRSVTFDQNSLSNDASGFFGGGHIGWNYQFAPLWVFGLRADIDGSSLSGTATDSFGNSFTHAVPWHGDFVARLGYLVTPQTLLYGVGGLGFGEIRDTAFVNTPNAFTIEDSNVHTGWVAGAGIEHYFTQNLSLGFEWNYFDLGTHGVAFVDTTAAVGSVANFNTSDKAAWNSFKGLVSVKF